MLTLAFDTNFSMDPAKNSIDCLSSLLLRADGMALDAVTPSGAQSCEDDLPRLLEIASSHHVTLRAFPELHRLMVAEGSNVARALESAMTAERSRIDNALRFLSDICEALEEIGDVIVIKSLDHWPDLGTDLDLYTNGQVEDVVSLMQRRFGAQVERQSWGDRLANKWNFLVPDLPELVEVHIGRLGQTGEQIAITNSLVTRARTVAFGPHVFRVPGIEEQIVISTLQRMYRHFYLRLCDIVNIARLVDRGVIDYAYLQSLARSAAVWDGLATYLVILAEHVERFRGYGLALPDTVTEAARFDSKNVRYRHRFLRIPIFPQAAGLYAREWTNLLCSGELQNALRLSLLPGLAMAALVAAKVTGSDKGIW